MGSENLAKVLPSFNMPPGDPLRPAPSRRPSDAPPSSVPSTDPSHDLAAALHEISNALTVLLGWVDAARSLGASSPGGGQATPDPRALTTALDVVASRAAHARDIARRAIGGSATDVPPSPVASLLHDAAHALTMEARRADVSLLVDIDPAVVALPLASGPSLLQVLTNLLLNAIAFSPPGSDVRLSAHPSTDDRVLIRVEDQGPGIPPEMRGRLFDGGKSSRRGGAGIGLRHSAALASRAGGELHLGESTQGARFDLTWPTASDESASSHITGERPRLQTPSGLGPPASAVQASGLRPPAAAEASGLRPPAAAEASGLRPPAAAEASGLRPPAAAEASGLRPPAAAEASGLRSPAEAVTLVPKSAPRPVADRHPIDGARILIVEDDDAVIDLLELALEARGASVVSVRERAELPVALATGAFDAALLDMSPLLGDVQGAVEALHRASPGARLVVMSGSVPQSEISAAAVWVRKPFEVREIVDALGSPLAPGPTSRTEKDPR